MREYAGAVFVGGSDVLIPRRRLLAQFQNRVARVASSLTRRISGGPTSKGAPKSAVHIQCIASFADWKAGQILCG